MTSTVAERQASATSWLRCPGCHQLLYRPRADRNLGVCPGCSYHWPLTAAERLAWLLDDGSATALPPAPDAPRPAPDFVDTEPYAHRIARAQRNTGLSSAVTCVAGRIGGEPLVVAVMDFRFLGGSLGSAEGELVTRAGEEAAARGVPLLLVTASGGARMQEGVLSLLQMAKTSQMLAGLDARGVLTVSLITDPTFGGVAASFATLCDVVVIEPGARLGFAGPRVIRQTIRQDLPEGFQTAEFLREHGQVDVVAPRSGQRAILTRLLRAAAGRRPTAPPDTPADGPGADPAGADRPDPWDVVRAARDLRRPTTLDYVHRIFDDFQELHGDRLGGDCPAVVGGVAVLAGRPVVLIGHQKGHDAAELAARNFGMPVPAGYRKAHRLMRLAAKLGLPVVTLVDTPGAYPGVSAEEHGQAVAIAENLRLMATLPVPIVTVVTGEGGSGGALALAVADRVLMLSGAVFSVISPEGCASILWKDPAHAPTAARALRLTAPDLLALGVVDGVLPEPPGGVQADPAEAAVRLRDALVATLAEVAARSSDELTTERHRRFRDFGTGRTAA